MCVIAKGDAGTVHKYPEGEEEPKCGAYTPQGITNKRGAERRHEVDLDDVDPWKLCQDCFPDEYKEYPENDHWFDVKGAHQWKGKLGSAYTCFVECTKDDCDFIVPCSSKKEAYDYGYHHKRYPDREAPNE